MSRLTSSFTCQLISVIITTLSIHHSFTLSLQAQNLPIQQILPILISLLYSLDCLHDTGTGQDSSCLSLKLEWLNVMFADVGLTWYLLNSTPDRAALFNTRCVVRQVEHGRIVVAVANAYTERTEPCQPRCPEVLSLDRETTLTFTFLGLDRDAVVGDADLCLSVEDIDCAYNARVSFHLEPFDRLIVGLHQRVRHVAVWPRVKVNRSHLQRTRQTCIQRTRHPRPVHLRPLGAWRY